MNILRQVYYKKLKNLIFMAYCYKYENQMKDEKVKKLANEKLKEILNSDLDISTLKLIVLKFISQNQHGGGFKFSKHLKRENPNKKGTG
jgi:hypothetical protein